MDFHLVITIVQTEKLFLIISSDVADAMFGTKKQWENAQRIRIFAPHPYRSIFAKNIKIMNEREQIDAFAADLQRLIDRYRAEFNLTIASAIGTLEVVKLELFRNETNK